MAELAAAGAAAFTDDGRPVVSAGLMRRALQYSALAGRPLALHCEEPALSRGGHAHEGSVSAELGLGPYPSTAESLMVERDLALARRHGAPAAPHAPLRARVGRGAASAPTRRASPPPREVTPHHLCLTDEAVRSLDPNTKMNPPLRGERRPQGADGCGSSGRHDRRRRHGSCASREAGEGRAVRGGAVRRHRPRDGVRGPPHPSRAARACSRSRRSSSGCRPARPASSGSTSRRSRSAHAANLVALDLDAEWKVTEERLPLALCELVAARRDAARAGRAHRRRRARGVRGMTAGYLLLEDGTVFPGPLGRRAKESPSGRRCSRLR